MPGIIFLPRNERWYFYIKTLHEQVQNERIDGENRIDRGIRSGKGKC